MYLMAERRDDLDNTSAHPEKYARREFALLLHRLLNLPEALRARLQREFVQQFTNAERALELSGVPEADKLYAEKAFSLLLQRLQGVPATPRVRLQSQFAQRLVDEPLVVETPRGSLSFVSLGKTAAGRAASLLTKQPATIEWIDSFQSDSVFWDVGANIGVYALYAALRGDTKIVAFEPAAVNYFLLAASCEVNAVGRQVDCLLLGLGSDKSIAQLEVSQFEPAQSFSFSGKADRQYRGRQAALIMSMDQLVEEFGLACPNYVKIDVPGLTSDIIAGGRKTLRRPEVRELHIEFRETSKGGRRLADTLRQSGFVAADQHAHGSADVTFVRSGVG